MLGRGRERERAKATERGLGVIELITTFIGVLCIKRFGALGQEEVIVMYRRHYLFSYSFTVLFYYYKHKLALMMNIG